MPPPVRVCLLLATALATSLAVARGGLALLDAGGIETSRVHMQQGIYLDRNLHPGSFAGEGIVLTDSLGLGARPLENLGHHVNAALKRRLGPAASPEIEGLSYTGMDLHAFYFFSERIVEARPRLVVLEMNLFWFADYWQRSFRAQLSGFLPASRWPEAMRLPLEPAGVTADKLIAYRMVILCGLAERWLGLQYTQLRVRSGFEALERAIQKTLGDPRGLSHRSRINAHTLALATTREHRSTRYNAERSYASVLAGLDPEHPTLQVLDAFLERMQDAGIEILVYVPPHNLERARAVGLETGPGLDLSLARIESVVRRHGGAFADFHALLPDSGFRDHLDHLVVDLPDSPIETLGDEIAAALIDAGKAGHRSTPKEPKER